MFESVATLLAEHEELQEQLGDPALHADAGRARRVNRRYAELSQITVAVDEIVRRLREGGRLIYLGAGTAGRLGVLDASEIPPTFGTPPELVQALIAGGAEAIGAAVENAEDDAQAGRDALADLDLTRHDAVVGIAASGRTPYVLGGLEHAREVGAFTVGLSNNPGSAIGRAADLLARFPLYPTIDLS